MHKTKLHDCSPYSKLFSFVANYKTDSYNHQLQGNTVLVKVLRDWLIIKCVSYETDLARSCISLLYLINLFRYILWVITFMKTTSSYGRTSHRGNMYVSRPSLSEAVSCVSEGFVYIKVGCVIQERQRL